MGDGWEIQNPSEKVQSVHFNKRSPTVSQMRSIEGAPKTLSKSNFDSKSSRQFSECSDIEHFDTILLKDSKTVSPIRDVKHRRVQDRDEEVLISSCGFIGDISVKEKSYNSEIGLEVTTVEEEDEGLKMNWNTERETMTESMSFYQSSSLQDNENIEENNGSLGAFLNEKKNIRRDFRNSSLEAKTNDNGGVVSLDDTMKTVGPTAASPHEEHESTDTNSADITAHHKQAKLVQEKENSKRRISFRALVRMKGLGRRMRKKHQSAKKREKYSNHRNESGSQIKEFKSDSSAKHLLESSTSTSDEQTFSTQMKIAQRKEEPASYQCPKNLQRSQSLNHQKDQIFLNSDEFSCPTSENICSSEYLERRRGAMCEELEKTLVCGQQSLADLRAILVVQQKLTGFGLL